MKDEQNFDTVETKQARNMDIKCATMPFPPEDEGVYPDIPKIEIDVDVSGSFDYYHDSRLDTCKKLMKQYGIRQCFVTLTDSSHRNGGEVEHRTGYNIQGSNSFNDIRRNEMQSHESATNIINNDEIVNALDDAVVNGEKVVSDNESIKQLESQNDVGAGYPLEPSHMNHLQCPACPKSFKTRKLMRDHKAKSYGNRVYRCKRCDKWFSTRLKLDNHINVHLNRRPHKCSTCNATFTSNKNLCRHLKNHTVESERKFGCPHCPKRCNTRRHIESHIRMHTNERRFKCSECEKTYKYDAQLRIHHRLHTGQRFHCEVCKKPFVDKAEMKRHMVIHSDLRPYKCDTCGAAFKRKGVLNAHISRHGNLFNITKEECTICGQKLKFKHYLKKHMEIHDPNRPSFKCHVCGKVVATKKSLRRHMENTCPNLKHSEYPCDICEKSFRAKAYLWKHKKQHSDGDKYPCKRCDKSFAFLYHLQRHKRRAHDHTDERRGTKCKFCPVFCSRHGYAYSKTSYQ